MSSIGNQQDGLLIAGLTSEFSCKTNYMNVTTFTQASIQSIHSVNQRQMNIIEYPLIVRPMTSWVLNNMKSLIWKISPGGIFIDWPHMDTVGKNHYKILRFGQISHLGK